jgi:hypothetical protein
MANKKPSKDEIKAAKRDADRLKRDARRGRSQMDLDPAAQEVLDDEAAQAVAKFQQLRDDGYAHHRAPSTNMGERGHRHGGAIGRGSGIHR